IPAASAPSGSLSGLVNGRGSSGVGLATGIEPALPDPRVILDPNVVGFPKSLAQRNDSAMKAIFGIYRDSAQWALDHPDRDPRDWTVTRANGDKWGMDAQYIRLGKYSIPTA